MPLWRNLVAALDLGSSEETRAGSIRVRGTFIKNKYGRRAANGSEIADIPVYKIAFFLLPVL